LITLAIVTLIPPQLFAGDTATLLAPVLDDQSFAILRVHMTSTQLEALTHEMLALVDKHVGQAGVEAIQNELMEFNANAGKMLDSFEQAGADTIYLVFSLKTLPGFLVVAPTHKNPDSLIQVMKQMSPHTEAKALPGIGNPALVVAGPAPAMAQLSLNTPGSPKQLTTALAVCHDNSAVQCVLAPSPDLRSIVKQMLPQIPLGSGSIPLGRVVDNLQWMVAELKAPPQTALSITTNSPNGRNASLLNSDIQGLYTLVKQIPQVRDMIPRIDALFGHLTPIQQDRRLSLKVDQTTTEAIMKEVFAPSLVSMRKKLSQRACRMRVSGLGKAMLIYSNDYEDQFPLKFKDLRLAEVTEKGMRCPAVKTKDSYVYRGKGLNQSMPPTMILLYDKLENHNGTGRHLLFLNSQVEWVSEERFQALIRQDNALRRKRDLPELPAR